MKALTIRNVDTALGRALERETRTRGGSLNETVLTLLRRAVGIETGAQPPTNGLAKLAGGWSAEDLATFENATASFEKVDDELWS